MRTGWRVGGLVRLVWMAVRRCVGALVCLCACLCVSVCLCVGVLVWQCVRWT